MNLEIEPPTILNVSDPEAGLTGWLAVDSVIDDHFCGGLRMLPDVSTSELAALARAMTLKHGIERGLQREVPEVKEVVAA